MMDGYHNRKVATLTHIITDVNDKKVVDMLKILERDGAEHVSEIGGDGKLVDHSVGGLNYVEFSPYLDAFGKLVPDASWEAITGLISDNGFPWKVTATVEGQESISVPAGTFQATKVKVHANRQGSTVNQLVRMEYVFWFAPEIKRVVKQTRNTFVYATGARYDIDIFELVSYKLN